MPKEKNCIYIYIHKKANDRVPRKVLEWALRKKEYQRLRFDQ